MYLKPFFCSSAFVGVCVFNVWPKTTLLPVWPRDAKRLDSPGGLSKLLFLDLKVNGARDGNDSV